MTRLFIASSSEAYDRRVTPDLATSINEAMPSLDIRIWNEIFRSGRFIVNELIEEAQHATFAVFLFTKDDTIEVRGREGFVTRDNILLEAGMFLAKLSTTRIAFIREADVIVPSDLGGVVYLPFTPRAGLSQKVILDNIARQLSEVWGGYEELDGLGLRETLGRARRRLAALESSLSAPAGGGVPEPFDVDGDSVMGAYGEALGRVRRRFWTSSFLQSDFWNSQLASVMEENRKMQLRVAENPDRSIRRVFILPSAEADFLKAEQASVMKFRDMGDRHQITERQRLIDRLRKNLKTLKEAGCEIRVAHDANDRCWDELTPDVRSAHDPSNTEIAIFDDFRVDLYRGRSLGTVERLTAYALTHPYFGGYRTSAERYFESLWEKGDDPFPFLDKWEENIQVARDRINYTKNHLFRYDNTLGEEDEALKEAELDAAVAAVVRHFKAGPPSRYIDVGTCTGRYPLTLIDRKLIAAGGEVVVVDPDSDCIAAVKRKFRDLKARSPDVTALGIEIDDVPEDFLLWNSDRDPEDQFDLVTCMLGTLSHFGVRSRRSPQGRVAEAVNALAARVAPGGLLIIGNWSAAATRQKKFIDIYTDTDLELLRSWTAGRAEIDQGLKDLGFEVRMTPIRGRIDIYVCTRPGGD